MPHSRKYTPALKHFAVFIPSGADTFGIDPASAIVANVEQLGNDDLLVYYEGNRFNASNLRRYSERIMIAAGRQSERYPTIAKSFLPAKGLIQVGTYNLETKALEVSDRPALEAWLDGQLIE